MEGYSDQVLAYVCSECLDETIAAQSCQSLPNLHTYDGLTLSLKAWPLAH